jgi:hypothetical protein
MPEDKDSDEDHATLTNHSRRTQAAAGTSTAPACPTASRSSLTTESRYPSCAHTHRPALPQTPGTTRRRAPSQPIPSRDGACYATASSCSTTPANYSPAAASSSRVRRFCPDATCRTCEWLRPDRSTRRSALWVTRTREPSPAGCPGPGQEHGPGWQAVSGQLAACSTHHHRSSAALHRTQQRACVRRTALAQLSPCTSEPLVLLSTLTRPAGTTERPDLDIRR